MSMQICALAVMLWSSCPKSLNFFFFFFIEPHDMWDLSSPIRDQTLAPCIGSLES